MDIKKTKIICPFCHCRTGFTIVDSKNRKLTKKMDCASCRSCKTTIHFEEKYIETLCYNLNLMLKTIKDDNIQTINNYVDEISTNPFVEKFIIYDPNFPEIGHYRCIVCNNTGKHTKVARCKEKKITKRAKFLYTMCLNCDSRIFIKEPYYQCLEIINERI